MKEAQIPSVALFFFYTFLDKSLSLKASVEALQEIQNKSKKRPEGYSDSILVHVTYKVWKKYYNKRSIKTENFTLSNEGWLVPSGVKLETWRQFVKEADPQNYLCIIWSLLLSIADKEISEGLGITEGSVRYRIGVGLKHLGQISQPNKGTINA